MVIIMAIFGHFMVKLYFIGGPIMPIIAYYCGPIIGGHIGHVLVDL